MKLNNLVLFHEIFSLFKSIDSLILEGFKDDMYRLYPEAKDNPAFNNAIRIYNSDENKIKDAVKKKITINGNVANAIKNKFPDSDSFIDFIDDLAEELNQKAEKQKQLEKSQLYQLKLKIGDEYKQIRSGKLDVSPTDYWMIPCHTFEEVHASASKYTGNLPRLSKEEITNKYGIDTPKQATFYNTDKTPAEFLEYMKNEDRFFMAPTWCVAADQGFFNDYELETSKDEKPLCYVFISKKYPNVRFCVVLQKNEGTKYDIFYEDEMIKVTTDKVTLCEVRDPWQIGGEDVAETGLEMMKLAFGPEVEDMIENLCHEPKTTEMIPFSELKDGAFVFYNVRNAPSISCSFDNLIGGYRMFMESGFKTINCKFPVLTYGRDMFYNCPYLTSIITDISSLEDGESMFLDCNNLEKFECKGLPKLKKANRMFENCSFLKKFEYNLPKLTDSFYMFDQCRSLETFIGNLSNLKNTAFMFARSGIRTFKSNLPKLVYGAGMFCDCENLKRFDTPLPKLTNGMEMFSHCGELEFRVPLPNLINGENMFSYTQLDIEGIKIITESLRDVKELNNERQPIIHLGMIPKDDETKHYIQIAENKGWKVEYQSI